MSQPSRIWRNAVQMPPPGARQPSRVCLPDGRWFDADKSMSWSDRSGRGLSETLYRTPGGLWALQTVRVLGEAEAARWLLTSGQDFIAPDAISSEALDAAEAELMRQGATPP